jgi:hypothetical protein
MQHKQEHSSKEATMWEEEEEEKPSQFRPYHVPQITKSRGRNETLVLDEELGVALAAVVHHLS